MKKTTLFLILITFTCVIYAQDITLIDFGLPGQTTGGSWNNITDPATTGVDISLNDTNSNASGIFTLTDAFDDDINGWGTTSPSSPASDWAPDTATGDNFFGEDEDFTDATLSNEPTGGFTLSGLEDGKYYSFNIFASRIGSNGENRETLYTITGNAAPQTATLDAAENTSNVATILNIQPNSGVITIQVEKGVNNNNFYGFYYIGAMEMTKTDNVLSSETKSLDIGTVSVVYPNTKEFIKINLNLTESAKVKMDVFDITGKKLTTLLNEEKSVGPFTKVWNTSGYASGIYILNVSANGKTQNTKFVIQ
ncbi:T9SS type A sorting domain-containing protein [Flavobacteriaceae bacterium XHP0103]|uniref:T9SS type A sorting domain-containing protein n=1 Tax=Marixanthotalea marina TaxID=2844359 RepID=UPI002989A05A|nr:T9SS type A sorting domain-containing protein [Marixanthotalea marina]MBU3820766.1 T9SS type A sorting domain-containing protein [Marixanthotalea marina]